MQEICQRLHHLPSHWNY